MRIIVDYRPALRERTGVGEYVHELARALASLGRHDEVIAFSSSWKDRLNATDLPGVRCQDARIPVRLLNWAWHRAQWPPIERLAGAADIAHSAHPLLMPSRRAAQVITIHDLDFLDHPERTTREIRRDYPTLAVAHARRADLVVVSSRTTAADVMGRLGVSEERIAVCPAGAPPWPARDVPPPRGYFLFVGTLEPRKNIGALLGAYRGLVERDRDVPPLHLAGSAVDASAPWLEALNRAPLQGKVIHLGYVPAERKRALYAGALALVVPSLHEGFGLTALEAMTLGVPVIASRRGSLPELLGDAALFVDPENENSIASAMERVAADAGLARVLGDAGRSRAAAYSWTRSAEVLRNAYESALRVRKGRA